MHQQLEDLRYKNQKLIYNILPAHVAKDFIGSAKSDEVSTCYILSLITNITFSHYMEYVLPLITSSQLSLVLPNNHCLLIRGKRN